LEEKSDLVMSSDLRIVFMGTPTFAVGVLDKMVNDGLTIVGVVTATDKPAGRGQQLQQSAVKQFALAHDLPVLQPERLKDEQFIEDLKALQADLFVVVAFRMLPEVVWSMPPKGTINLHASLLPNYRGAAPINWAIMNGEQETGVTTFFIEKEIDTGNIIAQTKVPITLDDTAGTLHDKLMTVGSALVVTTVRDIETGHVAPVSQTERLTGEEKDAPKLFKEDTKINWNWTVEHVVNHILGLSPFPTAWCTIVNSQGEEKQLKIYLAKSSDRAKGATTEIVEEGRRLFFPCCDGYVEVLELQPEGKRKMTTKDFLAGNSLENARVKI
jgi:methionyl-tRNA formyltransferase